VAGIAAPGRFFSELRAGGWQLAGTRGFRDHHRYSHDDLARLAAEARAAGAVAILTTEKDFVRLLPFRPFPISVGWVPLTMELDPLPAFRRWLSGSLDAARDIPDEAGSSGLREASTRLNP
jgi:tetraacyldisaccharide 4'-kinase